MSTKVANLHPENKLRNSWPLMTNIKGVVL